MGRAGEGWNPLRAGYLQYAVFALRRQEESEKRLANSGGLCRNFHTSRNLFVKTLQVLSSWW
jgi:hypothetical protein